MYCQVVVVEFLFDGFLMKVCNVGFFQFFVQFCDGVFEIFVYQYVGVFFVEEVLDYWLICCVIFEGVQQYIGLVFDVDFFVEFLLLVVEFVFEEYV